LVIDSYGLVGEREEDHPHGDGQQQDGDAEVAHRAEDELQELEDRPGAGTRTSPSRRPRPGGHAELLLIGLELRHGLGAAKRCWVEVICWPGPDAPRGAGEVGLEDRRARWSWFAEHRVDLTAGFGSGRPASNLSVMPVQAPVELNCSGGFFCRSLYLKRRHAAVEPASGALMHDLRLADVAGTPWRWIEP
jgi:hypothetical protein